MRIIGGTYRGRTISIPKGLPVRPTTDRTREALFNILIHQIVFRETRVLDLFAGTGMISLECISRGAQEVIAVDSHRRCVQALIHNRDKLAIKGLSIIQADAKRYVATATEIFDLVFMDPPYAYDGITRLTQAIQQHSILSNSGIIVIEHDPLRDFSHIEGYSYTRKYGSSSLTFIGITS